MKISSNFEHFSFNSILILPYECMQIHQKELHTVIFASFIYYTGSPMYFRCTRRKIYGQNAILRALYTGTYNLFYLYRMYNRYLATASSRMQNCINPYTKSSGSLIRLFTPKIISHCAPWRNRGFGGDFVVLNVAGGEL
jgi:hypothetical protein